MNELLNEGHTLPIMLFCPTLSLWSCRADQSISPFYSWDNRGCPRRQTERHNQQRVRQAHSSRPVALAWPRWQVFHWPGEPGQADGEQATRPREPSRPHLPTQRIPWEVLPSSVSTHLPRANAASEATAVGSSLSFHPPCLVSGG